MRVLLTGATGFLGKEVLARLLADPRVSQVQVLSRKRLTHPHPKVQATPCDLTDPAAVDRLDLSRTDAVIHLAGSYDFEKDYRHNYLNNVVATEHLVACMTKAAEAARDRRIPIHYASTYAVTHRRDERGLPPKSIPYAQTKAITEKIVLNSGIPGGVYRIGVLVGRSTDGAIEKIDGPYYLLKLLYSARGRAGLVPLFPVPGQRQGTLPLVPVNVAADVFIKGLFSARLNSEAARVYGVYNPKSVRIEELASDIIRQYMPRARPVFLSAIPERVMHFQQNMTGIPASALDFSLNGPALDNPEFERDFPDCRIPHFSAYREAFFSGFERYMEGPLS